jgi:cell division protease FtsH
VNEAALLAARQGKEHVEMADLDEAIEREVAGLQKKSRVINPREKRIVAYHESGHALVAELVPGADPISKISIIPRGVAALGYTQQLPSEDRNLLTRSELLARISVLLGGRVAEELVFEDVSTGAQNDLQRATEIARTMVTQFGMSQRLGLVSFEGPRTPLFLQIPNQSPRDYSEETARQIDEEVKKILADCYSRVTAVLSSHRPALNQLAEQLLEKEVVDRSALQGILKPEGAGSAQDQADAPSPESPSARELPA